jgi:hypothetical protein
VADETNGGSNSKGWLYYARREMERQASVIESHEMRIADNQREIAKLNTWLRILGILGVPLGAVIASLLTKVLSE